MTPRPVFVVLAIAAVAGGCSDEPETRAERPDFAERPGFATRDGATGSTATRFTDVTRESGLDFTHVTGAFGEKWMPETMGSGGGFFDYDGDGWPDVLFINSTDWPGHDLGSDGRTRLFRNRGDGTFEDVSARTGMDLDLYGMGMTAADYDGDGDVDVYVTAVGSNRLMRNDGGRFTDVTARTGTTGDRPGAESWSTAAVWVDVDLSGTPDLFVCNYVKWTPETDIYYTRDGETKSYATPEIYEGDSCRLYRNDGKGSFTDVTDTSGVFNPEGKSLGIAVDDFNRDGWPDLVVANDTYPNFLYRNDGDGTFTDVGVSAGVAFDENGRARAGMGIDVADVTSQGRLSIAIGNFSNEPVSLFTQMGGGLFQNLAGSARLNRGTLLPLTFGLRFADLDLDGFQDLLIGNGHIEPEINDVQADVTFEQRPQLFWNNGRGQFVDVSDEVGEPFARTTVARAVATADYDRDGDLDVLITVNGGPAMLLRNDLPANDRWVRLILEAADGSPAPLGTEVTVFTDGRSQRRMVRTGSSYLAQSETNPVIFGLGEAGGVDSVWVRWPISGDTTRIGALAGATEHTIRAGR